MNRKPVPLLTVALSLIFIQCLAVAASPGDSVLILSVPGDLNVYIVPTSELTGTPIDAVKMTSRKFIAGKTPLKVNLARGEYKVSITGDKIPGDFGADGEDQVIEVLNTTGTGFKRIGKTYHFAKKENHRGIVTALFWSRQQPVESFLRELPAKTQFKIRELEDITTAFKKRSVPQQYWEHLFQMLEKTGKAVWFQENGSQHLFLYFTEFREDGMPTRLITDPAE